MSFLDKFFKSKQKTPAEQAKERLLRIVVESRGMRGAPDFVPRMKEEILPESIILRSTAPSPTRCL